MVDWKKEIKLSDLRRKQSPEEEPTGAEAETVEAPARSDDGKPKKARSSVLKKEISFKRKPKPKAPLEQEDEGVEEPKQSRRRERGSRRTGAGAKRAKRLVGLKIGASQ